MLQINRIERKNACTTICIMLFAAALGCNLNTEGKQDDFSVDSDNVSSDLYPEPTLATTPSENTQTPSPTSTLTEMRITPISIDSLVPISEVESKTIRTAFWSDDGAVSYFGISPSNENEPLMWVQYSPSNNTSKLLDKPPSNNVWFPSIGYYPELEGLVSPSGNYRLEVQKIGEIGSGISIPVFELCLINSLTAERFLIIDYAHGRVGKAEWSYDERWAVLSIGYEGPKTLFVLDVKNHRALPLSEMSNHEGATDMDWTLSPNGTTLAVSTTALQFVSLETGKTVVTDEFAFSPRWSVNSNLLYYWGPTFEDDTQLRVYDIATNEVFTLLSLEILQARGICQYHCYFSISPDGNKILFWFFSDIWIVEFI